jgi:ankyrin repeat protein
MQEIFRLFLSYPDSGRKLAAAIEEIVVRAVKTGPWKDYYRLEVCMWDHADNPVFLDAFGDPNDQIFSRNFPPSEADLFLVCLTNRIGDGTIQEVRDRARRGDGAGLSDLKIFLQDTPPSRLAPDYTAAKAAYEEMHEWLDAPFERTGHERRPLNCAKPFIIRIESPDGLLRHIERVLVEALQARFSKGGGGIAPAPAFDPYPGLTPLRVEHAECIFGRDRDIAAIAKARAAGSRFLMVWGASGVGKSSLVQAGIIGGDHAARSITIIPGKEPARQLADAIQQFIPATTSLAIRHAPDEEIVALNGALAGCDRLYMFIDQFERLYLASEQEIADFTRLLGALARIPKCTVIITHRSDQMPEWARRPPLSAPGDFEWSLHPMTDVRATYLRDVIREPARKAGKAPPEPELVDQLVEDFDEQRNATPLLALTLHDLYEASGRGARPMALADYLAKGGLKGMLYERTRLLSQRLTRFGFEDERLQALFSLIVDFDHEGRAVAKAAARDEVVALFDTGKFDPWEFVEQELVRQFFLRSDQADGSGAGALTIAHEVFFEEWSLLRKWIEDNKYQIQQIRELEREAERWEINGRSPAYLLPQERLDTAMAWMSGQPARFRASIRQLASDFVARSDQYAKEKRIEEAIFRGEIIEVDDLLREGVKARAPLPADAFAPFYDVIWGDTEPDDLRAGALSDLGADAGPLNRNNAVVAAAMGFRPIHFAALAGRMDKIRLLVIGLGIDVNLQADRGTTPLVCAATAGRIEAVKLLLSLGAKPEIRHRENGLGAADWANERGHVAITELLLNQLGDFSQDMPVEVARGLIVSAAQAGDGAQLGRFLPRLADGEHRLPVLQEALWLAAARSPECVALLVNAGADPVQPFRDGRMPLHLAAALGDPATLAAMMDGLAPDQLCARDRAGHTALTAAIGGNPEGGEGKVALLLAAGCDPSLGGPAGVTPLMLAAGMGLVDIVELLVAHEKIQLEARDKVGNTAIMFAASEGHSSVVRLLLKRGADPRSGNEEGATALIVAAGRGHEDVVQLLLANGAAPGAADNRGYTALLTSARMGHYPIVAMILGSLDERQVNAVDKFGWTALEHAVFMERDRVAALLLQHGARLPLWAELAPDDARQGERNVAERD